MNTPYQLNWLVPAPTDLRAKNLTDLMSRCWFHLGKTKRTTPILHEADGGDYIKVSALEETGIATIYDQDLLLFLIAKVVQDKNDGKELDPFVRFTGADFWDFLGKKFSKTGKITNKNKLEYDRLDDMVNRLKGTQIETNIRKGPIRENLKFNWLSSVRTLEPLRVQQLIEDRMDKGEEPFQKSDPRSYRKGFEVELPEWIMEPIRREKPHVLTYNHDYFKITKGIERFLYQFARKASGSNPTGWFESLDSIYQKSGSTAPKRVFLNRVRKILEKNTQQVFVGLDKEDVEQCRLLEYQIMPVQKGRKMGLRFTRNKAFPSKKEPMEITN